MDFKLPETSGKRKPRPTHWLHTRAKDNARHGIRNSSYFARLLSCCLPLPPLKRDPYKARPHCAPEPTQPASPRQRKSRRSNSLLRDRGHFLKGKCPRRPQPRGSRTLVGKPQASGLVWAHVLASHPSWVPGQWQELPAAPRTGGCAEGKGVP